MRIAEKPAVGQGREEQQWPMGMSIVTKKGDQGMTTLMYNRRVAKTDPRVEAYGSLDELNSALGLARASTEYPVVREGLLRVQKDLVVLMGELATLPEDRTRYIAEGFPVMTSETRQHLDQFTQQIEDQGVAFKGWVMPGETREAAALDFARTVARRAERQVCVLKESDSLQNPEILAYLNRLSDLLWLLARWVEAKHSGSAPEEPRLA